MAENDSLFNKVIEIERNDTPKGKVGGIFAKEVPSMTNKKSLNFNLTLNTGITLIAGNNGSGKTSLIKALDPLSKSDYFTGRIHYYDALERELDFQRDYGKICNRFAAVYSNFKNNPWPKNWTISQILLMLDDLKVNYDRAQLCNWLDEFHLAKNKSLTKFSAGEKVMISLFLALIRKPDVLLLDEIGSFLSIINRPKILGMLKSYGNEFDERSIIITSNHPGEDAHFLNVSYVVILDDLEIKNSFSTEYMDQQFRGRTIEDVLSTIL